MTTSHPDAATIDRLGRQTVSEHFGLSRQSLYYWRKNGVPRGSRNPVKLLGESLGHDMSDFCVESTQCPSPAGQSGEPERNG